MRTKVVLVSLCVLLFGVAVQAQEFWQKKDPSLWSEGECKRLFNDSPWAKQHDVGFNLDYSVTSTGSVRTSRSSAETPQTGQSISYIVSFWSAQPVRQGYVQFLKLRTKYDKMPAEKKEAAEKTYQQMLNQQPFSDSIVLQVRYDSSMKEIKSAMASYWQQQTLQSMKTSFYLIAHGKRIEPVSFSVTPDDFIIAFPRTVNGEPIVKPGDKSMAVEFHHPKIQDVDEARVYVEFPMKKMLDAKGQQVF